MGYSPWGRRGSETTERLTFSLPPNPDSLPYCPPALGNFSLGVLVGRGWEDQEMLS